VVVSRCEVFGLCLLWEGGKSKRQFFAQENSYNQLLKWRILSDVKQRLPNNFAVLPSYGTHCLITWYGS